MRFRLTILSTSKFGVGAETMVRFNVRVRGIWVMRVWMGRMGGGLLQVMRVEVDFNCL